MFKFIDKERCLQNIDPKKLVTEQHIQPDPMHEELKTKAERVIWMNGLSDGIFFTINMYHLTKTIKLMSQN